MIELDKKEPSEKMCSLCGRPLKSSAIGVLIHWPNKNYPKQYCTIVTGERIEPFSFWAYRCQWCKAVETKRQLRNPALL